MRKGSEIMEPKKGSLLRFSILCVLFASLMASHKNSISAHFLHTQDSKLDYVRKKISKFADNLVFWRKNDFFWYVILDYGVLKIRKYFVYNLYIVNCVDGTIAFQYRLQHLNRAKTLVKSFSAVAAF